MLSKCLNEINVYLQKGHIQTQRLMKTHFSYSSTFTFWFFQTGIFCVTALPPGTHSSEPLGLKLTEIFFSASASSGVKAICHHCLDYTSNNFSMTYLIKSVDNSLYHIDLRHTLVRFNVLFTSRTILKTTYLAGISS